MSTEGSAARFRTLLDEVRGRCTHSRPLSLGQEGPWGSSLTPCGQSQAVPLSTVAWRPPRHFAPHSASEGHSESGSHFGLLQASCRVTWLGLAPGQPIHSLFAWRRQRSLCYPQNQPNIAPNTCLYKQSCCIWLSRLCTAQL